MSDEQNAPGPVIKPRENGSLRVDGLRHLIDGEGNPISTEGRGKGNIALCRCGASGIRPFCDGSHRETGFRSDRSVDREGTASAGDEAATPGSKPRRLRSSPVRNTANRPQPRPVPNAASRLQPGPVPNAENRAKERPPTITITPAGPYLVTGGIRLEIADDEWPQDVARQRYPLCRCGHSGRKPFCDGSHANVGFDDPGLDTTADDDGAGDAAR